MLSRNQIFLSAIFILIAGFFFLSSPELSYAQPESDCCIANEGLGCSNQVCENTVCAQDLYCCDIQWDQICADQANDLCEVCREPVRPVRNVPAMSEWGMIAFAGILGLVGFFYVFTKRKRTIS
jgi:hypothetical protein